MLCASRRLTLATAVTLFIVPVLYSIFVLDMKITRWEESVATASGPVAPAAPSGRDDGCGSTRIVNKRERCLWAGSTVALGFVIHVVLGSLFADASWPASLRGTFR